MSVEEDQKLFDRAYEARELKRAQLASPSALAAGGAPKAGAALQQQAQESLESLRGPSEAVAFGRIDEESGETWYIGYDLIMDEQKDPLVVSWQSDPAARYNQATRRDPLGVLLKRVFETRINTIVDHHDQRFADEADADSYDDFLLRELTGHRSGRMKDIVRTLQATQDRVMRLPADQVLVVEGGPGTGKTIVGLQRISVLLFREDVSIDEVAFVGPTPGYLRYVSTVLPSLGSDGVRHLSVTGLAPGAPVVSSTERPETRVVKGDRRMRELITRAVADRRRVPEEAAELQIGRHRIQLAEDDLWNLMSSIDKLGFPHNEGRRLFSEQLAETVARRTHGLVGREPLSPRDVNSAQEFQNLLNRTWPSMSAQEALRDLLSSERRLRELSWSLLDDDEVEALFRPAQQRLSDERWTLADIALLDAFADELTGPPDRVFRHMVVDEVQDLTPMQLLSIARRSSNGALTLLGDLGQGFGDFARTDWQGLLDDLGVEGPNDRVSLDTSYRLPDSILDLAARVVDASDLPAKVPTAARADGSPPQAFRVDEPEKLKAVVTAARQYLADGLSVGVIAAGADIDRLEGAFAYEGIAFVDGRTDLGSGVTIVPAPEVRGLEFDACVVLEPASIAREVPHGQNLLYVVVTRPTRRLSIVHSDDLPEPMGAYLDGLTRAEDDAALEPSPEVILNTPEQGLPEPRPMDDRKEEEPSPSPTTSELPRREHRIERALSILGMLAEGHTYEQILAAVDGATYVEIFNAADLGREALAANRRAGPPGRPARAGDPWNHDEDLRLIRSVEAGQAVADLASDHQRSHGAIRSRINRLVESGDLPPRYRLD